MARKNTVRSLAEQIEKLKDTPEWQVLLDALYTNSHDLQRRVRNMREAGVSEDQDKRLQSYILACKTHSEDIMKLQKIS